ncbi:hypothetical protein [Aromatoleum anaerobium]|uniref:Uncharacterized protein n=1 Tax=Aromatoleum anaerobium TaxID=182180 RepID=A0ABX1PRW9_9RHOO|nr:hypothetical protein [Aromatoleum anaerobium]MCK0507923.1 hypothetical protein [Aromatoleum anaerobium]
MAALILPRRFTAQPQGAVEIDPNNRFGVTAIALGGGFACTVNGPVVATVSDGVTKSLLSTGPAYRFPGTNTQATFGSEGAWKPPAPFTVMMAATPSSDSVTAGFATSDDGAATYAGWSLLSTGGASSFKLTLRLGNNGGGGASNRSDFIHSTRITLDRHVFGVVVRAVDAADVILDAVIQTPVRSGTASSVVYTSAEAGFGNRATGITCAGDYEFLLVANRALTVTEWESLADNPWQVLCTTPRRLYFDVGVSGGGALIGALATTETGSDVASLFGAARVAGTLLAQESGSDTAALTGSATSAITGTLAAIESGADAAAVTAVVGVVGALSAAETGADVTAVSGAALVQGALSAAESGADASSMTGDVLVAGALGASETGSDTAGFASSTIATGTLAAVESGADSAALAGVVAVQGALSAAESGADATTIAAAARIQGALAALEAGSDTAAFAGDATPESIGTLAAAEAGTDSASVTGVVLVRGSAAITETDADTAIVVGKVFISGTLAASEAGQDTAAINGLLVAPTISQLTATLTVRAALDARLSSTTALNGRASAKTAINARPRLR